MLRYNIQHLWRKKKNKIAVFWIENNFINISQKQKSLKEKTNDFYYIKGMNSFSSQLHQEKW